MLQSVCGVIGEVGLLYYQQEEGITTVSKIRLCLRPDWLIGSVENHSSTTCVSSPYPAKCQKDYSVIPVSKPSLRYSYYSKYLTGCQEFFEGMCVLADLLSILCGKLYTPSRITTVSIHVTIKFI